MKSHIESLQADKQKKQEYFKSESNKLLLAPFRAFAKFTAIAGLAALILEVKYFPSHSVEIYLTRLSAIVIAFLLLVVSNTDAGKRHPVGLTHILLLTIIASFGIIIIIIPQSLVFNSHIISLIIFTAALFLSWEVSNQIVVAIYYNLVFAGSILLNEKAVYVLPNMFESVMFVLFISVMAIVASSINYKLRREAMFKAFEVMISEKKYRNLFDNSADGIFQISHRGKFVMVNQSLLKIFGYEKEDELQDLDIKKQVFKKEADYELFTKMLEKQGKVRNYRSTLKKNDGSDIVVRMNARLVEEEEDEAIYFEGNVQDISLQVRAENDKQKLLEDLRIEKIKSDNAAKKALQESKFKTKFLANMSHEVRTPMNSVMGFLTLIENDLFESREELKEFAMDSKVAAESLLGIINNILDISKIEAGRMELDEVEFHFVEEVNKAIAIIRQGARTKGISFKISIDEKIPKVLVGDPTRYRQIIINLLGNALKFTEAGEVLLKIKLNNVNETFAEVHTEVVDSGPGIPKDKLSSLFAPYSQVRHSKEKKEGTGLGLVISKEFVTLMGGKIGVDSTIGVGTTFFFTVKFKLAGSETEVTVEETVAEVKETEIAADNAVEELMEIKEEIQEEPVVEGKVEKPEPVKKEKKRLLLVEDNPISQNLELKILREVGYAVDAVSNAHDAINRVKEGIFDLVLMDIEMSDMDGLTATKKIRELESTVAKIPIIAVTAHSSMKDREKCLAAGMDDYIAKPINIHFLKITIDQWLNAAV